MEFAQKRGEQKTYCPSEVAKVLYPDNWRDKMNDVRAVADDLWLNGQLIVSQFGKILDTRPSMVKGHIRLRMANGYKK